MTTEQTKNYNLMTSEIDLILKRIAQHDFTPEDQCLLIYLNMTKRITDNCTMSEQNKTDLLRGAAVMIDNY